MEVTALRRERVYKTVWSAWYSRPKPASGLIKVVHDHLYIRIFVYLAASVAQW